MILFILSRLGLNILVAAAFLGSWIALWLFFKGADTRKK